MIGTWGPAAWEAMRLWPLDEVELALGDASRMYRATVRKARINDLTISQGISTGTQAKERKKGEEEDSRPDPTLSPFRRELKQLDAAINPPGTSEWRRECELIDRREAELRKAERRADQLDRIPVAKLKEVSDAERDRSPNEDRSHPGADQDTSGQTSTGDES